MLLSWHFVPLKTWHCECELTKDDPQKKNNPFPSFEEEEGPQSSFVEYTTCTRLLRVLYGYETRTENRAFGPYLKG